jgi:erythritol transport system ATP-binding protein
MDWIIEKMIGKKLNSLFVHKEHEIGEVIFRVEDITLPGISGGYTVDHVSFELHSGEIIGIYGLKGAGRSEMLECLAGTNPLMTGKVYLEGQEIVTSTTLKCIQSGLVLVPEDRQRDGLVPTLSVAHNIVLASLEKYLNRFRLFLVEKKEKEAVNNMIEELSIKVSDPGDIVVSLSGGNQQKVIIAKSLLTDPKVLMLDEPTRGIDIGAKHEVFEIMGNLAAKGYGVLFVSSESKEILAMSDRIIVMSKGKITGEFTREEATEEKLIKASVAGNNQEKMNKKQEVK